jgi:hypothetical protein
MRDLLLEVESLFFADPFQFTDGHEFGEALRLLRGNPKLPEDQLRQELFALELNHVAGRGLFEALDLQSVLISWGESLLQDTSTASKTTAALAIGTRVDSAKYLFSQINERGGGDDPIGD